MYDVWKNQAASRMFNNLRLEIIESGYAKLDSVWCYHGVCSPFSRLYIVRAGDGIVHAANGQTARLLPGRAYLLPAGLPIDHWCDTYLEKLFFHLKLTMTDGCDLFERHGKILEMPIELTEIDRLSALYRSNRPESLATLQAEVYAMLVRMIDCAGIAGLAAKSYSPAIARLFPLIQCDLSSKMTVRSLAQALNMSESTLTKRFRAEVGVPLGGYIDDMLLQRARQLLLGTDLTIGQIAEQLCFCDQFYFSRYFRQRQGLTPSEYRRAQKHLT